MVTIAAKKKDDVAALSTSSPSLKRAERVADRIVGDVMAMGWPAGEVLGCEADLLGRYRVSRAVFREAVRLIEHKQVARTRRGPGGGLIITEPASAAVLEAVVVYLYRVGAEPGELAEASRVLDQLAGVRPVRGRQAVALFRGVLARAARLYREGRLPDEAVFGDGGNGKLAQIIARQIASTVVRGGMRPGQFIGSERDLIERHRVSRAVFREAVRLLEHHRIARMRRGPGGGLFASQPGPDAVTDIAAIYLARRGGGLAGLAELAELSAALRAAAAGRPGRVLEFLALVFAGLSRVPGWPAADPI
ncbi:MAG TPA: hypothetical protein VFQ44_12840 [Streptosporangiaceae bacterium]|nr:hypothetical protein [Streptosporangiaceae bacterium]